MTHKTFFEKYIKYIIIILTWSNQSKNFSFGNDLVLKANKSSITLKNKKSLELFEGLGVLNLGHNPEEILKVN